MTMSLTPAQTAEQVDLSIDTLRQIAELRRNLEHLDGKLAHYADTFGDTTQEDGND